jgi:flagellar protein FliO/FliZ
VKSQFELWGGVELKLPLQAMQRIAALLLWAGLLIQIPIVSAQEAPEQEIPLDAQPSVGETLRSAEQVYSFEDSAAAPPVSGPSTWIVVRAILILALSAAAIYGIVFFLKKASKKTVSGDPFLKLLASAHLGSNRYAHIVSVGNKAWLLGSSDGGVNLIGEIDDKDLINSMLLEESKRSAEAPGKLDFGSLLRRFGLPSETRLPGADEIRKRRERLKGM